MYSEVGVSNDHSTTSRVVRRIRRLKASSVYHCERVNGSILTMSFFSLLMRAMFSVPLLEGAMVLIILSYIDIMFLNSSPFTRVQANFNVAYDQKSTITITFEKFKKKTRVTTLYNRYQSVN